MTTIDQTQGRRISRPAQLNVAYFFAWWRKRQRIKRDQRNLAEMPNYLLRDVGLEHLSDLKSDIIVHYRML